MSPYRSRLEAVIRQRLNIQNNAQVEFSEARDQLIAQEVELGRLVGELDTMIEDLGRKQTDGMNAHEIDLYHRFIRTQYRELEKQRLEIQALITQCDRKREALTQAYQDRKVVEKIEENRRKDYRRNLNKNEQRFFDEIAERQKKESP